MKILIRKYQGTIYPEDNGYTGAIDLGFDGRGNRIRIKRRGRTKAIVREQLDPGRRRARRWHHDQRRLHGRRGRPRLAREGHQGS